MLFYVAQIIQKDMLLQQSICLSNTCKSWMTMKANLRYVYYNIQVNPEIACKGTNARDLQKVLKFEKR